MTVEFYINLIALVVADSSLASVSPDHRSKSLSQEVQHMCIIRKYITRKNNRLLQELAISKLLGSKTNMERLKDTKKRTTGDLR